MSISRRDSVSVLGISAYYHNSAAALVDGGRIVGAASEERFTRVKHDSTFPIQAINFCLQRGEIKSEALNSVVFYEEPHVKFSRVLASVIAAFPRSRANFTSALKNWLLRRLWICNEISCLLRVDPKRVRLVPHHVSHAAQAFLTSPFESAAILTMDAVGEWACTAISKGELTGEGREIKIVESIPYPHSIGLVFSAFTAFLGFQPNGGEANTMALAAFGRPTYAGQIREILRSSQDGLYTVDVQFFNFLDSAKTLFTKSFIDVFGRPRDLRSKLPFAVSGDSSPFN